MNDPVLRLEHIKKCYGDFTAVHDLSLLVPRGSIYGFLGPNGAGKSTTIRIALSIYEPTAGTIEVLGHKSAQSTVRYVHLHPEAVARADKKVSHRKKMENQEGSVILR